MSLGENIQFLRKRKSLTQEEFAEKLGVSRQTVSKWESENCYPEMDKLLQLCDIFGCDMDTLMRGDASQALAEDTQGYDAEMNRFTRSICTGTMLVLGGLALMMLLIGRGLSENLAIMVFLAFIAIAAAIFIISSMQHGAFVRKHPQIRPFYSEEEVEAFDRKFPYFIAIPTVLILLAIIALIAQEMIQRPAGLSLEQYEALWAGLFLLVLTLATPLYIYGGMQKAKYNIPEYNKENAQTPENLRKQQRIGTACGSIMLLATAIYLVMGLGFNRWELAPIPFAAGGLLCAVASMVLSNREA